MRSVVLVCLAVLLTGCGHEKAPTTMKWSERVLVGSLIGVIATSAAAAAGGSTKDAFIAADVGFGVLAVASVGTYLAADLSDDGPPMTERERKQAQAWQLTKRAQVAARKDDCGSVAKIEPRVSDLDPSFHEVVFLRDVAIDHCLHPAPPPPPRPAAKSRSRDHGAPKDSRRPNAAHLVE
jgi:hypothetical protein